MLFYIKKRERKRERKKEKIDKKIKKKSDCPIKKYFFFIFSGLKNYSLECEKYIEYIYH